MKRKLTDDKVKEFIKDEIKGYKTYRKYGFKPQARDEHRHARYFKKKYKKMEKKEHRKNKK